MDRAALLTAIYERNAARKQAQLPLLDVRAELRKACDVAAFDEWQQFIADHKVEWDRIEADVLTDMRVKHGPAFPSSGWSRMLVNAETEKRFAAFADLQYGVHAYNASRNYAD